MENLNEELRKELFYKFKELEDLAEPLKDVSADLENLKKSQTEINEGMSDLQSRTSSLESEIGPLNEKMSSTQAEVGPIKERLENIESKIDTIESAASQTTEALNSLSDKVDSIQTSLSATNNTVSSLTEQVEGLQSSLNTTNSAVTSLTEDVNNLQTSLSTTNNNLISVTSQVQQIIDEKIPELESKISQSGGGEKPWITLYDKDSDDPNLNKGTPEGVTELNYKTAFSDIDLMPYNKIKILFGLNNPYYLQDRTFDISERKLKDVYVMPFHTTIDSNIMLFIGSLIIRNDGEKCTLAVGRFYRWYFNGTKFNKEEVLSEEWLKFLNVCRVQAQ